MKPGDSFECPHCGQSSFLKKESVMDGWTKKGEILACAACSVKIADLELEKDFLSQKTENSVSVLADLLGAEEVVKPELSAAEDEKHFCRDCGHFISHPFMDRCSLHEKDVNPMDDCQDFFNKAK